MGVKFLPLYYSKHKISSAGRNALRPTVLQTNGDAYVLLKGYTAGNYNLTVKYRQQ